MNLPGIGISSLSAREASYNILKQKSLLLMRKVNILY